MKTLILTRHAKSSWGSSGLDDHDRPLNGRGRRSAAAMGDWLRQHDTVPDQILSSSAKRTRETCEHMGFDVAAEFTHRLYHAGPDQMLDILQGATGDTVQVLGHNPGIAWLAEKLIKTKPDHLRFYDFPTCATLVLEVDIDDWSQLKFGSGRAVDFMIPRDLLE